METRKGSFAGDDYLSKAIDGAIEQVPGVQFGKDAAATLGNSFGWALAGNEAWRGQEAADATYRSLSRIVPNDPVTQWLLLQHFEHNVGIKQDSQRGKR
ncbi:MAG: hypothetical protein LZT29_03538 [Pantoea stewartii]|nr:MAG: hypothetical protein LZT29_03538 [Pantoea stewartii]